MATSHELQSPRPQKRLERDRRPDEVGIPAVRVILASAQLTGLEARRRELQGRSGVYSESMWLPSEGFGRHRGVADSVDPCAFPRLPLTGDGT